MWSRPFDDESDAVTEESEAAAEDADYTFEGFNIEFSTKVALTAAASPHGGPGGNGKRHG
jgi:hypothetical protein